MFDKYRLRGAYHWGQAGSVYEAHAQDVAVKVEEDDILDAGAGDGYITHLLRQKGKRACGIDTDEEGVRLAQERSQPVRLGSVYDPPKKRFGAIYLGDVIEHLERPVDAIKALQPLSDVLYIATPPREGQLRPHHVQEYTESELKDLMQSLGWECVWLFNRHGRLFGKFRHAGES